MPPGWDPVRRSWILNGLRGVGTGWPLGPCRRHYQSVYESSIDGVTECDGSPIYPTWTNQDILLREVRPMTKRLVDLDDADVAAAREALGTKTLKDTVVKALASFSALTTVSFRVLVPRASRAAATSASSRSTSRFVIGLSSRSSISWLVHVGYMGEPSHSVTPSMEDSYTA